MFDVQRLMSKRCPRNKFYLKPRLFQDVETLTVLFYIQRHTIPICRRYHLNKTSGPLSLFSLRIAVFNEMKETLCAELSA